MTVTALIVENILIGCFTWAWIAALLFRVDVLTVDLLKQYAWLAKDYTAATTFFGLLLVYPVGVMMNTVCYVFVSWLFAERINRPLFKDLEVRTFNEIYVYVLQHGSKELVEEIQSFIVPVMRLSRAAIPNFLALGLVLLSWFSSELLTYAFIAICIGLLGLPAFYFSAKEWKGEFVAAYRMLRKYPPKA